MLDGNAQGVMLGLSFVCPTVRPRCRITVAPDDDVSGRAMGMQR